jgi:hypothetical protein
MPNVANQFYRTDPGVQSAYRNTHVIYTVDIANGTCRHILDPGRSMHGRETMRSAPYYVLMGRNDTAETIRKADPRDPNPGSLSLRYWLNGCPSLVAANI